MLTLAERIVTYFLPPSLHGSLLLDVLCALFIHRVYNKYEFEPANVLVTLLLLLGIPAIPCYFLCVTLGSVISSAVLSYMLFYATLALSVVLYRISPVHPLARYSGPLSLKISKFVRMYHAYGGKQHILFKNLHEKYGPFVRVGPNELSIVDADALAPIFEMEKGPLWDAHSIPGTPHIVAAIRDVPGHNERRKLWNHAFSTASLKEFQPLVQDRILDLVAQLGRRASDNPEGEEISLDLAQWMANFQFDVMGDLVLGGGLGCLESGDTKGELQIVIDDYMRVMNALGHAPWIMGFVHKMAAVPEGPRRLLNLASERYDMRKEQEPMKEDIFHYITNEAGLEKGEVSRAQGINDIVGAMIGGTDNVATILSGIFYYLLSNRSVFDRLKREIDSEFPREEGEPFDPSRLAKMPYLNAVINETLRLQPPEATGLQRSLQKEGEGQLVAGRFIPEGTAVYVPTYVLHRDTRYFSPYPDSFIPERWLETEDGKFTTNASTFVPFSIGYANCVGKNLAWMEMRMVIATIVQKFDMNFAEGYDSRRWAVDLRDILAMKVGSLDVILRSRE